MHSSLNKISSDFISKSGKAFHTAHVGSMAANCACADSAMAILVKKVATKAITPRRRMFEIGLRAAFVRRSVGGRSRLRPEMLRARSSQIKKRDSQNIFINVFRLTFGRSIFDIRSSSHPLSDKIYPHHRPGIGSIFHLCRSLQYAALKELFILPVNSDKHTDTHIST